MPPTFLLSRYSGELGFSANPSAQPVRAAFASAGTFAIGAALPLFTALLAPGPVVIPVVVAISILLLAFLGGFAASAGGAPSLKAALRVTFWGALAIALTAAVGAIFGAAI